MKQADPGDTIHIPAGVYRETVIINKSLELIGSDTDETIVDGDTDQDGFGNGRVFYIGPNVTVTIAGMTIQNGDAFKELETPSYGGGILNQGTLTVRSCDIRNNTGDHGGGIANWAHDGSCEANLTVYDSTVHDNLDVNAGGGISNIAEEGKAISNVWSTNVSYNKTKDPAGGIQNWAHNGQATVHVWGSTIHHNSATGAHGGGIQNWAENSSAVAVFSIESSNIEQNDTGTDGGGIWNWADAGTAIVIVRKSDILFNKVNAFGGPGGGILSYADSENSTASLDVYGSRIGNNTAFGGGGIYNSAMDGTANATVWESDIHENSALHGSGIFNIVSSGKGTASLRVRRTTIQHNTADGDGAICNFADKGTATADVCDSELSGNISINGGGIFSQSTNDGTAALSITRSSIIDNTAKNGTGISREGKLTIQNHSISNAKQIRSDSDSGLGGGIFSNHGFTIVNSTISGNRASGSGGGIYVQNGELQPADISFVTCTQNIADDDGDGTGDGGGIFAESSVEVTIKNSIVAANADQSPTGDAHPDGSGNFVTESGNVVGNNAGCEASFPLGHPNENGDIAGSASDPIDARLGPLGDNGGETRTHALLSDSPAIDSAVDCYSIAGALITEDQRHVWRPQGPGCDSGAYEAATSPIPTISLEGVLAVWLVVVIGGVIGIRKRKPQVAF